MRTAESFVHGVNYPWSTDGQTVFYGLDFGSNVWGSHLGVSTRRAAIARDFDEMARLGFVVARWFVFCDGRAGIVYDDRSLPAGLDGEFFGDVDAALEIARDANMRLDFVLLDHHWLFRGIRHTLADLRDQIFAFEFMNEPDFVVEEWERDRSRRVARALPFPALAAAIGRLSNIVHAGSPAIVTLGGARADNLWAWDADALGLDVLQLHAYPDSPHPGDVDVFSTPARALDVRREVILGEFRSTAPLDESLEKALTGGYAGAWPWSFSGTDTYGRLEVDELKRFGERHPALVNPRFAATKTT